MVAGVHYEGRDALVKQYVRKGQTVFFVREFLNPHSSNAVQIRLNNGVMIGYVPEADAVSLAPLLDRGAKQIAIVKKILTGGRVSIPVIVADIYDAETVFNGALAADQIHFSAQPTPKTNEATTGCGGCITFAVALILLGSSSYCC